MSLSQEEKEAIEARRREKFDTAMKSAPSKRALAWNELKQGINPDYVAMKYGYDKETMRQAAAQLEERAGADNNAADSGATGSNAG